jgi:hypothetical protein
MAECVCYVMWQLRTDSWLLNLYWLVNTSMLLYGVSAIEGCLLNADSAY